MLKNKFNSHDWFKILELRKITAKAFNEIPEFCLAAVFDTIFVNLLPILIYTVDFMYKYSFYVIK